MQLHDIKPKTTTHRKKIIGRGGKRGTTSGRGTKGQKARAGHRIRPEIRDTIKKLPKRRGHGKNLNTVIGTKPMIVTLAAIAKIFTAGSDITPEILSNHKLIRNRGGRLPQVKILGNDPLSVKLTVLGCLVSAGARKAIETAGGTVS